MTSTMIVSIFGHEINMMAVSFLMLTTWTSLLLAGILFLFWRIQRSEKLDFADILTKNGKSVSLTKVLQLVGGLTATWIMVRLTLTGGLTEGMLGIYLTYVGGVEAYSKFVAAKYGYDEKSIKTAHDEKSIKTAQDEKTE